jgi:2-aminobenzoate-CoA ligase
VLPAATRKLWKDVTGIEIIDGIGATEMLHIFISHDEAHAKPGATEPRPATGCGDERRRNPVPPGKVGRLAVKGPTAAAIRRRAPAQLRRMAGTTPATLPHGQ